MRAILSHCSGRPGASLSAARLGPALLFSRQPGAPGPSGSGAESQGHLRGSCFPSGTASGCEPPSGQKLPEIKAGILTGVEFEEKFDSVIIEVAAVQDDLDQRGEAALPSCRH